MEVSAIKTTLAGKALQDALVGLDAVVLDRSVVKSVEEIMLASHLAEKSFADKSNIANKMKYEFLLFLCGKTNLKSAFGQASPKSEDMLLIVFSGSRNEIIKKLGATEKDPELKERGEPLDLERISCSRIRN